MAALLFGGRADFGLRVVATIVRDVADALPHRARLAEQDRERRDVGPLAEAAAHDHAILQLGGAPIPSGVVTDAAEATGHCAKGVAGSSSSSATTASTLPSACPGSFSNSTAQAATDGTVCVGYCEVDWAGPGYYFPGSGTVTGHVELGDGNNSWPGGPCMPGNAYAKARKRVPSSQATTRSAYLEG